MSLKTVSIISLTIVSLVFIVQLVELYSYLQLDSEWVSGYLKFIKVIDTLLWLPFMLFFGKIIKG
jgi:hypothetical protein